MKIEKSTLDLSSSSAETTVIKTTQQLEIQTGTAQQNGPLRMELDLGAVKGTKLKEVKMFEIPEEDKSKIRMLNKMLEAMTGKKMRFYIPEKYMTTESEAVGTSRGTRMQFGDAARSMGWGIRYQSQETIVETAEMSFSAAGVVKTADGRTIDIDLQLNLSRSFSTTSLISFSAGNAAIDPLVVNFDGPSASLTTQKYSFDLDQDGTDENISFVGSGSGFLVLDKNLNGLIDNGGEMFGPSSGSGFIELKAYDEDGNNWIDENDPVFDRLQIWTKDENGNDRLFAIGQAGVGAIYLGAISGRFALKDISNALQGEIRENSIFLRENATVGTIQHVDLSV